MMQKYTVCHKAADDLSDVYFILWFILLKYLPFKTYLCVNQFTCVYFKGKRTQEKNA